MAGEEEDIGDKEGHLCVTEEDLTHMTGGEERDYCSANTFVLWDLDDYPFPKDVDDSLVYDRVISALLKKGIYGVTSVKLFGGNYIELKTPEMHYVDDTRDVVMEMLLDLYPAQLEDACWNVNAVLIAKATDNPEMLRVLECLKSRNHTLLLMRLPDPQDDVFPSTDAICADTYFLSISEDERPIQSNPSSVLCEDILDFSKPIPRGPEFRLGVFWDVEDFPLPELEPQSIFEEIEKAFVPHFKGGVSVWAYVDEKNKKWNKFVGNKTWKGHLYFLPGGGNKSAREERMSHDIQLWSMDKEPDRPILMLILDQFKNVQLLYCWEGRLRGSVYPVALPLDYSSRKDWARGIGYCSFKVVDWLANKKEMESGSSVKKRKLEGSKDEA